MYGKKQVAAVAVWCLVNASGLALAVAALVANAVLFGPHTSMWTSAWGTAVAACLAYGVVEKVPVLATGVGPRRTLGDVAMCWAYRVAIAAGIDHCDRCASTDLAEYCPAGQYVPEGYICLGCGHSWHA